MIEEAAASSPDEYLQVFLSATNATNRSHAISLLKQSNWIDHSTLETAIAIPIANVVTGAWALVCCAVFGV